MDAQLLPSVIFENEKFLCIFKPSGFHSAQGKGTLSVADWIAKNFPKITEFGRGQTDCGLLNRLDQDTSGILIAAKSVAARELFLSVGEQDDIEKKYICLTYENSSLAKEFACDFEIGSEARNSKRVTVSAPTAQTKLRFQSAHTEFKFIGNSQIGNQKISLYDASITNGRRHQIRAHAAASGIALVNDPLYKKNSQSVVPELGNSFFLHNYKIISPKLGLTVECPVTLQLGDSDSVTKKILGEIGFVVG